LGKSRKLGESGVWNKNREARLVAELPTIQLVSWGGNYIRTSKPEALHLWMRDLAEGTIRRLLLRRFTPLYSRLPLLYRVCPSWFK